MNDDIKFEVNDKVFNYRIAIVIKNNNKILVQIDNRANHYTLPGGRCQIGESSIDTGIREFEEETGIKTKFVKGVGIIENFFTSSFNNKRYHEILIINELTFCDKKHFNCDIINNIEENKKEHIKYIWIDLKELEKANFKPELIIKMIKEKAFQHYINKEY